MTFCCHFIVETIDYETRMTKTFFTRNLENETKRTKKLVKGLELQLSVVEGQMLVEEMNEANHNLGSSFSLGSNNAASKGF